MTTLHAPPSSSTQTKKIPVPCPLPSRRSVTHLPPQLRENVTTALLSTQTAIPALQNALSSGPEAKAWMEDVQAYLTDIFRGAEGDGPPDSAVLDMVLKTISSENGGVGGDDDSKKSQLVLQQQGQNKHEGKSLSMPRQAVDEAVRVLKKELEAVCVVVDDVDWDGLG